MYSYKYRIYEYIYMIIPNIGTHIFFAIFRFFSDLIVKTKSYYVTYL